ncbi:hypothetical protein O3M35_004652 [Rhynocoris fuscipes]|uniref:Uncharacterized protein n=1 Tax=Rhynocoris fuscipes TaxID=488301 RepID=A0AAW1CGD3_9HEMI
MDTRLSWKDHINALAAKLSRVIYLLRRLVKEVDPNTVLQVYYGLFHSHLSYGIELWASSTDGALVFKLQKKAVRILAYKGNGDSCRCIFKELKITTLTSLFIYRQRCSETKRK